MNKKNQSQASFVPRGEHGARSILFFFIALVAGNIIFTISAMVLGALSFSDGWRLGISLVVAIIFILFGYLNFYYRFSYQHAKVNLTESSGKKNERPDFSLAISFVAIVMTCIALGVSYYSNMTTEVVYQTNPISMPNSTSTLQSNSIIRSREWYLVSYEDLTYDDGRYLAVWDVTVPEDVVQDVPVQSSDLIKITGLHQFTVNMPESAPIRAQYAQNYYCGNSRLQSVRISLNLSGGVPPYTTSLIRPIQVTPGGTLSVKINSNTANGSPWSWYSFYFPTTFSNRYCDWTAEQEYWAPIPITEPTLDNGDASQSGPPAVSITPTHGP